MAFPICQNIPNEGNALKPSFFTTLQCRLYFSVSSSSQLCHRLQMPTWTLARQEDGICQPQIYFTFICLPKLFNEVPVTDSLTICHLLNIFKPQQQCAILKNLTMMLYEPVMCYTAGVTQTAKPIWFSHYFFHIFQYMKLTETTL